MISRTALSNSQFLDDGFHSVDASQVGSAVSSVGTIVQTGQQQKASREDVFTKTSCKKPKLFASKRKKAEYEACLQQFIAQSQLRQNVSKKEREEKVKQYIKEKQEREKYIMGIPKPLFFIGVGLVAVVGGMYVYKNFIKK